MVFKCTSLRKQQPQKKKNVFACWQFQSKDSSLNLFLGVHMCLKSLRLLKQWNITRKVAVSFKGSILFPHFSQWPKHIKALCFDFSHLVAFSPTTTHEQEEQDGSEKSCLAKQKKKKERFFASAKFVFVHLQEVLWKDTNENIIRTRCKTSKSQGNLKIFPWCGKNWLRSREKRVRFCCAWNAGFVFNNSKKGNLLPPPGSVKQSSIIFNTK